MHSYSRSLFSHFSSLSLYRLYVSLSSYLCIFLSLSLPLLISASLYLCLSLSLPLFISASLYLCFSLSLPLFISAFLNLCLSLSLPLFISASLYLCLSLSLFLCFRLLSPLYPRWVCTSWPPHLSFILQIRWGTNIFKGLLPNFIVSPRNRF